MAEPVKLTLGDGSIIVGYNLEDTFENLAIAPTLDQRRPTRSRKFDEADQKCRQRGHLQRKTQVAVGYCGA
jgi:hypothetical protein